MKNSILQSRMTRLVSSACAAFLLGGALTSCSDDLLTGQPSWLGESIYQELQGRGNFSETLKLIGAQDEDYKSVLEKTGSKTLFVADDAAWTRFYASNPWGARSLDDLTMAQKRLLFKSNMINSAYLVELLANQPSSSATEDPQEGAVMRRATSVDLMDSVPMMLKADYPEPNAVRVDEKTGQPLDYWARVRHKDTIRILQDNSVASMIHFLPKFMQNNNITSEDVAFLTNGQITSNQQAFVNGHVITEGDITCQNGYIHILDGVAVPLDNMANIIAQNSQFSIYNRLLNRFSYPHFDAAVNDEYHRQYGGTDSVYVRKYFFRRVEKEDEYITMDDNNEVPSSSMLPYDPGWNRYSLHSANNTATFQQNAAVMLVPTDDALKAYLQGEGAEIEERYANAGPGATAWDNAPDAVVMPLLKNTMLVSLKAAIPSQFGNINNTAGENMGVQKADIDSVLWACNGVIYQTNKAYLAPEYVSVYFPCIVNNDAADEHQRMRVMYGVVDKDATIAGGEGFYAYLNNMGSKYSFVIPTDHALHTYYDPVSYKRTNATGSTAVAYDFKFEENLVKADLSYVEWDSLGNPTIGSPVGSAISASTTFSQDGDVFNHFKDIFNSSLAATPFRPGQKFYTARNGGPIIVDWAGSRVAGVAGSFQYERHYYIPVTEEYDKSVQGNGISYVIDKEPLMSTMVSPYAALTDTLRQGQFGLFARLLESSGQTLTDETKAGVTLDFDGGVLRTDDGSGHATMDQALSIFNNYHYTIYVPTNASIQALTDAHRLPTPQDLQDVLNCIKRMDADTEYDDREYMKQQLQVMLDVVTNFVNYHIQDNSVYVEGEERSGDVFESACIDTTTNRFVKLTVNYTQGGPMTVTDNLGNKRTVLTDVIDDAGRQCYNVLTRQYYFNGASLNTATPTCTRFYSSSFAVIHQIDGPLVPNANSYYSPEEYQKVQDIIAAHPLDETPSSNPIKRRTR